MADNMTPEQSAELVPLVMSPTRPTLLTLPLPARARAKRSVTPGVVLAAVKRRWYVAVPFGLTMAVIASAAVWTLRPDKSTSFALLRVVENESRILQDGHRADGNGGYTRTQIALIRSRPVLRAALKDERVRQLPVLTSQADPVEWLEKELRTELLDGTEIVRVSLTTRGNKDGLAPVLNAITEAYLGAAVKSDHATHLARLNDLQKVYAAAEEKVRRIQESIQGLTRNLNSGDAQILSLKQRTLLDEYAGLKREMVATNSKRRNLEVLITSYRGRLDPAAEGKGNAATVELELEADPKVQAHAAELARSKERLEQLDSAMAANAANPLRQDFADRVAKATAAFEAVRRERRTALAARQQVTERAAIESMLRGAEVELTQLSKQRDGLQEEVDALRKEVDRLGLNTVELELRRSELERSDAFSKSVWDQKERLEVELNAAARERVSVVAPAEDAAVLSPNARLQETAAAGLGGLLLGLLAVALLDLRRGRIHTTADVADGLQMPVLGSLPELRHGRPAAALLAAVPEGPEGLALAEASDGVRTLLLRGHEDGRGWSLMVSSPIAGEGKSTLAASLAASLARSGHRTLLVDGDLRRPTLHTLFSVESEFGLNQALAAGRLATDLVRPTAVNNLYLLPAGKFDPAAVAALPRQPARELFNALRREYEFLVIDSSPLLCVPDGFMLGRFADGLLFSVRPGVSQAADVHDGYDRVREHDLPFVGVVVNGIARARSYYRGYGYSPATIPSPTADAPA